MREGSAANIFVVAASDVVRAGLAALIDSDARFTVAGSAADLGELRFEEATHPLPDLVVLDAERQPERSLALLRDFAEESEGGGAAPVFVVVGAEDGVWVREALEAGTVRGLLSANAAGEEIVAALAAVSNGLVAFDPEAFVAVLNTPRGVSDEPGGERPAVESAASAVEEHDALTPREREVLDMLSEGLSNKEIAWRMKISEHTVKFHVASIFAKLDVSTRTEAVTQGIRRGLVMM